MESQQATGSDNNDTIKNEVEEKEEALEEIRKYNELRIYQMMVSSFQNGDSSLGYGIGYGPSTHNGDLRGIINSLDYIKDLNVNAIWLTPIFDSSNGLYQTHIASTGYFAHDYFKVDPHFGTEDDLHELINEAHNRNLYVFLDGVFGHSGGVRTQSPEERIPFGPNYLMKYPESLDYFSEVARYWIENFEIDGWRLDQCYQLFQDGHNYLREIRLVIEETCIQRRRANKKWGILGYVVGEHWSDAESIANETYSQEGLFSAFDFPSRYYLVQAIATEESGRGGYGAGCLANIFMTNAEKGYPPNVYPNMFIGNHDLCRLGNLIKRKYNQDSDQKEYWLRHKIAIVSLVAYTGPITLYYGEEYGDITEEWNFEDETEHGFYIASDNCSRTDGLISDLSVEQKSLADLTSVLMKIRSENPALWRGSSKTMVIDNNIVLNMKYDEESKNAILYVCNLTDTEQNVRYCENGSLLRDLIDGKEIRSSDDAFEINIPPLYATLYKVEN